MRSTAIDILRLYGEAEDLEKLREQIETITREFPAEFSVEGMDLQVPGRVWYGLRSFRRDPHHRAGFGVMNAIRLLTEGAVLERLRRCELRSCGRWFFAKFSHERFHDERCKRIWRETDPWWKEKRRRAAAQKYLEDLERDKGHPEKYQRLLKLREKRATGELDEYLRRKKR